jgi:hypothetical protein
MKRWFESYVAGDLESMFLRQLKIDDESCELPTRRRRSSALFAPRVVLWRLQNDVDTLTAELLDHGTDIGIELRFVWNGTLLHAWYFRTHDLASAEADDARKRHEAQGWSEA